MHSKKEYLSGDVKAFTAFMLLAFLILLVYSNTFQAAWQFDDKPNIIENQRLHIKDLSPSSLWLTFFAGAGKNVFSRPLANLSLALNWYAGQSDTLGFHIVNTLIHILTAFILYLTCWELLQTPNLKERYNVRDIQFIALLGAVLWAINPIQIQAVTYIVQRMASMAALFYVCSIYFYVKGRRDGKDRPATHIPKTPTKRNLLYTASFLCFIFALLAKENAIMLPASLLIVEVIFFQAFSISAVNRKHYIVLAGVGCAGVFLVTALYQSGFFDFIARGYTTRPFTMWERVLTQPRVVFLYFSQIFYPLPSRLSITHDVIVSTSLFKPWTTLPAIIIILASVAVCIQQMRKWPLLCFALLFFLLSHVVESSILPLELMFEHRNYLPSLFLFLPAAAALKGLYNRYQMENRFMQSILVTFVTLVIIGLGCFTYIRNHAWQTETSLWQDAMHKAPRDARPVVNLAIQLAWAEKATPRDYDVAISMLEKARSLNLAHSFLIGDIVNNIGLLYFKKGEYQKALDTYARGLAMDPGFLKMRFDYCGALIVFGKWDEASREADLLINNYKKHAEAKYFNLKGFILLWQQQPEKSLVFFQRALDMEPDNQAALLNKGVALSLAGEFTKADLCLRQATALTKRDIRPYYALVENSAIAGDQAKAEFYAQRMLDSFPVQTIIHGIKLYADNYKTAPISADIIIPVVEKAIIRSVQDIETYSFNIQNN